ncbi:MAG: DUF4190 domain-containing protein [Cyclobacteriaceae bacterium]
MRTPSSIVSEEKSALLEMPLSNLSAGLSSDSRTFKTLKRPYPSLIPMIADTLPKSEEQIEEERIRKEILRLKQEIEKKKQNFENPDQASDLSSDDAAIYKKANILAKVSFFSALLSPVIPFPLIIVSLVTGFMSLKRYRKVTNKKGRWMAMTGIILDFVLLAILIIAIVSIILLWNDWAA